MVMAKKLHKGDVGNEKLQAVIVKLHALHKKFSNKIPKSGRTAYLKGKSTQRFNKELNHGKQTGL